MRRVFFAPMLVVALITYALPAHSGIQLQGSGNTGNGGSFSPSTGTDRLLLTYFTWRDAVEPLDSLSSSSLGVKTPTQVAQANAGGVAYQSTAFSRLIDANFPVGSGPFQYSGTWSPNNNPAIVLGGWIVFSGVDQTTPIENPALSRTTTQTGPGSDEDLDLPAQTVKIGQVVVISCTSAVNITGPAGYTSISDRDNGSNHYHWIGYKMITSNGTENAACSYTTGRAAGTILVLNPAHKTNYGHYIAPKYTDNANSFQAIKEYCAEPGVTGVTWRNMWNEVEPTSGAYAWTEFNSLLTEITNYTNANSAIQAKVRSCKVFFMVEWRRYDGMDPCPSHITPAVATKNGFTCRMWQPAVRNSFNSLLEAAGTEFNGHPNVEGFLLQESSLGMTKTPDGYSAAAWSTALSSIITTCAEAFPQSRCVSFLNFIEEDQSELQNVAQTIAQIPNNQACLSGPDVLPARKSLYRQPNGNPDDNRIYPIIMRHKGCRSNSIQNDSYQEEGPAVEDSNGNWSDADPGTDHLVCDKAGALDRGASQDQNGPDFQSDGTNPPTAPNGVRDCSMTDMFKFAVGSGSGELDDGTTGTGFLSSNPFDSGLCINSYLFWNSRPNISTTELDFDAAKAVIAASANAYGSGWLNQCTNGGTAP